MPYPSRFIVNPIVSTFFLSDCNTKLVAEMGLGLAVVILVISVLAAIAIFSIFPPDPINILLGIILGLSISIANYAKEKYEEF